MKKRPLSVALLCASVVLGTGCATPPSKFYSLAPATESGSGTATYSVAVGPISIPETVDRPQIVVRRGAYQIGMDEFNRWASPLQDEIGRTVSENLVRMLGTPNVGGFRQPTCAGATYRVWIDVVRFDSELGKSAALDARWRVRGPRDDAARTGRTTLSEPVADDSYLSLVEAHSRALGRLSGQVADAIRSLEGGAR